MDGLLHTSVLISGYYHLYNHLYNYNLYTLYCMHKNPSWSDSSFQVVATFRVVALRSLIYEQGVVFHTHIGTPEIRPSAGISPVINHAQKT